jgi:hypothetical protein
LRWYKRKERVHGGDDDPAFVRDECLCVGKKKRVKDGDPRKKGSMIELFFSFCSAGFWSLDVVESK